MHENQRHVLSAALGMLALTVALAGCGQFTVSPNPTPTPPIQRLNALTLGDANGKVIDRLQNVSLEKYSGKQDINSYDLIIVDGDINDASSISKHPQILHALELQKPLLFVDVNENHQKTGIAKLIGFNTKNASDGYLIIPEKQPNGRTFYQIYSTSRLGNEPKLTKLNILTLQSSVNTELDDIKFASLLNARISQSHGPIIAQDFSNDVGPVQAQWIYWDDITFNFGPTGSGKTGQTGNATLKYTYNLFQDLKTNASQGGIQDLVVSTDIDVDPGILASSSYGSTENSLVDVGWFLGDLTLEHQVTDPNHALHWSQSGPLAENKEHEYTSGTSFDIGFDDFKPNVGLSWDSEKTQSIPDWAVSGSRSNLDMTWRFKSSTPDIDNRDCTWGYRCEWYTSRGFAVKPNELSTSESQYHTEVVYQTAGLISDTISINTHSSFYFYNIYDRYTGINHYNVNQGGWGVENPVDINFSAVAPQPIDITYTYDVAPGNATTIGSVILPVPAIVPVVVYLQGVSTANSGVKVPFSVTIPTGSRMANFPISINSDSTNGSVTNSSVTIQSLYGTTNQKILPILVSNASPLPPNNLTYDPQNWIEDVNNAPADSGWRPNYLVRYAVSYIDSTGLETKGPWSSWIDGGKYAKPQLTQIPLGPSGTVARRVYRQFYSEYQNQIVGHVISPNTQGNSIEDNITTNFADNTW